MAKHSRLNEYNFRQEVVPHHMDYQVTSCIAMAFSKADSENMRLLYGAFPLVCLDYFCWFNYSHDASFDAYRTARAMVQIGRDAWIPFDHKYMRLMLTDTLGFDQQVAVTALHKAMELL